MTGTANGDLTIAVCDRCHMKMDYRILGPDGNIPGLRVCPSCRDDKDPYRLPARKTETIVPRKPRPDANIASDISYLLTEDSAYLLTEDGEYLEK